MPSIFAWLLPSPALNHLRGSRIPVYLFALVAVISTVRSLIHIFAPDGGAGTIAGINLSVEGGSGIAFAFSLWGSAQLLNAFVQLIVLLRYRSLVPLMWLLLAVEILLRMLVGRIKPITFAHTPPGAVGNQLLLPLALMMLFLSYWTWRRSAHPPMLPHPDNAPDDTTHPVDFPSQ